MIDAMHLPEVFADLHVPVTAAEAAAAEAVAAGGAAVEAEVVAAH